MEDRALYEIMAPETEYKDTFIIDSDNKAEWALTVIKAEQADRDRLVSVCEQKVQEYQEKIEQFKKQYDSRTSYLISCLTQYFQTVPKKKTKTQETYQLPSGKLKLKYPAPEYIRDNEKLLNWVKSNNLSEYLEVKESPKWAELKKAISVSGDKVVDANGEIVDGITVQDRAPVFEIDI